MKAPFALVAAFALLSSCATTPVGEATPDPNMTSQAQAVTDPTPESLRRYSSMSTTDLCRTFRGNPAGSRDRQLAEVYLIQAGELRCAGQDIGPEAVASRRTYSRPFSSRYSFGSSDLDCADFTSGAAAQAYFIANGGPASDPNGLDRDGDGYACEWGRNIQSHVSRRRAAAVHVSIPRTRATPTYSSAGRCTWVNGYYRRNGVHVRGHQRCG